MARHSVDRNHLTKLQDYYARFGVLPSYAGISRLVGYRAKTAAVKLADRLSAAGYLRKAPNGRLAPDEKFFERVLPSVPVPAGEPVAMDNSIPEGMTIDRYLVDAPSQTVLVPVKGDSMKDAGILDGDIAVVDTRSPAEKGDFVVARLADEYTLKELDFEGKAPLLRPRNNAFRPIRPSPDAEVVGVVKGLVRRYRRRSDRKQASNEGDPS